MGAIFPFHARPADWQAPLANPGRLERLQGEQAIPLFALWVPGDPRT